MTECAMDMGLYGFIQLYTDLYGLPMSVRLHTVYSYVWFYVGLGVMG